MLMGLTHQEDITTENIYASNIRAHKCIKKTLLDLNEEVAIQ